MKQTAEEILKHHPNVELIKEVGLRERVSRFLDTYIPVLTSTQSTLVSYKASISQRNNKHEQTALISPSNRVSYSPHARKRGGSLSSLADLSHCLVDKNLTEFLSSRTADSLAPCSNHYYTPAK
jgi:hypothetical protein